MPKVPYFLPQEVTLLRIELQAGFSALQIYFLKVQQVLLESAANYNHVV
jgi:hypothetical protein